MQAITVLQKLIRRSIHARRLASLTASVDSALRGGRLTVSSLGRSLDSRSVVRHRIKRVDRLLGNAHCQHERLLISRLLCDLLIGARHEPVILPASRPRSAPTAKPAAAPLAWNIALIRELEWKRFEELCAQFWSRKGYPARLSGPGADGGVDVVIADQRDHGKIFAVAQCKSWSSKPVGVEPVRALWGAKDHFKANLALFYGLSGFTPDARAFAEGKHLKLISGEELLQQILAMPDQDRVSLLTAITRGDYTTPTCPTCDIKMNRRSGKDGKPDFWGCNNFRRCGAKPIPCRRN